MSKNLHNLKWDTVTVGDFPASITDNLQGFVGLEECTSYGFERDSKRPKKNKPQKKRQNTTTEIEVPNKKVKLSNGFVVESCNSVAPSLTNEDITQIDNDSNKTGNVKRTNKKLGKLNAKENQEVVEPVHNKTKAKLGADRSETKYNLTPEDMLTWAEFKLPEPILKALTELGFKQPTKIQQLSLPAAIHGRRDILGAAETGSGKTLAFGLPILIGIMKLKEKAAAGLDVYEIPYKKSSAKKQQKTNELDKNTNKKQKINKKRNRKKEVKAKESSEDGYSSGEESNNDETANEEKSEEEYLEEFEVPVRKREPSADEGNDSDSDNYVHMSDMLDSDDLKDNSDDEENNDEQVSDEEANDELEEEPIIDGEGIGCVKVMDNIDIPGHTVVKTGKPLYALVLTPTRELAIQVSNHLTAAAKYTGIRVATLVGGLASVKQERVLRYGPEIVVATPGRLWELVTQGQAHLQQLDCVKFLAIDETDRMIEKNHFDELYPLLERLNADEAKRCSRQNFVFSATLTMVHELPRHMRGKKVTKRGKIINRKVEKMTAQQKVKRLVDMLGMTDPKVVDITQQNLGTAETLTESRITCSHEHKDSYLYYILKRHPGRTIVFCNSIGCVKRLTQLFSILRCQPLPLHASMEQRQRLKNLERFRDDAHGVLVATDVAARGLDIPDVDHVVHYQVPRTAENYVHRSGRTARANKEGLTILMMEPAEAFLYSKMCRTLNRTSEVPLFPVAPQSLAPIRELLNVARTIEGLELKKRKTAQAIGWREKVAKEMDIIVDEDDIPSKQVDPSIDKALKAKRRDLNVLLSRPLIPRGFSFKYPTLNDPDALKCVEENALQVMKNAIQSGELKKEKRKSKNSSLLKLEKTFKKK